LFNRRSNVCTSAMLQALCVALSKCYSFKTYRAHFPGEEVRIERLCGLPGTQWGRMVLGRHPSWSSWKPSVFYTTLSSLLNINL
jgi:hypothetical protein